MRSASASPERERKYQRFLSTVQQPRSRKISYKDETLKYREHNLFSRKVPKNAEAVNIQVSFCLKFLIPDDPRLLLSGCNMRFLAKACFCLHQTEESDNAGGLLRNKQTNQVKEKSNDL